MSSVKTVMANGFRAIISNRHGDFYTSFALTTGDGTVLQVAIMGPYKTERKAHKVADKYTQLNQRLMDAGQPLQFVDEPTVPADVRVFITRDISAVSKQLDSDDVGVVFGRRMQ